jgi:hypothetical protein
LFVILKWRTTSRDKVTITFENAKVSHLHMTLNNTS